MAASSAGAIGIEPLGSRSAVITTAAVVLESIGVGRRTARGLIKNPHPEALGWKRCYSSGCRVSHGKFSSCRTRGAAYVRPPPYTDRSHDGRPGETEGARAPSALPVSRLAVEPGALAVQHELPARVHRRAAHARRVT